MVFQVFADMFHQGCTVSAMRGLRSHGCLAPASRFYRLGLSPLELLGRYRFIAQNSFVDFKHEMGY